MQQFLFQTNDIDAETKLFQIADGLEKWIIWKSKKQYPHMWKLTDQLRAVEKISPQTKRRRKKRYIFWAMINWILGSLLLIGGLQEWQTLWWACCIGSINFMIGSVILWRNQKTILALIDILLGIFLGLPAYTYKQEFGMLYIFPTVLFLWGILAFVTRRYQKRNPFLKPAETLAKQQKEGIQFLFHKTIVEISEDGFISKREMPITEFVYAVETKDLFLIFTNEVVQILQKSDLVGSCTEEFSVYLAQHMEFTGEYMV